MATKEHRTDADLLAEFAGTQVGDAFSTLVERHGSMVHSVSFRILSNHHDAQEVTQAVFLRLAREARKLNSQPSVTGWLHTVARRLALDRRKSREIRSCKEQEAMNEFNTTPAGSTVSPRFLKHLDSALQKLPERYRQPLILFHLEGISLDEISNQLSLNPHTLRTRLARAREILRNNLNRRGVGLTSVSALTALLAVEAKSAVLPPALVIALLDKSFTSGVSASSSILQLAGQTCGTINPSFSSKLTQYYLLMKAKTTIITVTSVILLSTATWVAVNNQKKSPETNPHEDSVAVSGRDREMGVDQSRSASRKGRRIGKITDLNEAEQSLLDFDFSSLKDPIGVHRLMARAAAIDPSLYESLMNRLESKPLPELKRFFLQMAILNDWAKRDWGAAFARASGVTDPKLREKSLERVFIGLAEISPEKSMKLAEALQPSPQMSEHIVSQVVDAVYDTWLLSDPAAAVGWADSLPPGKVRDQQVYSGLIVWVSSDRSAALRYTEALPEGGTRAKTFGYIAADWFKYDPSGAREWIEKLPAGLSKDRALRSYKHALSEASSPSSSPP